MAAGRWGPPRLGHQARRTKKRMPTLVARPHPLQIVKTLGQLVAQDDAEVQLLRQRSCNHAVFLVEHPAVTTPAAIIQREVDWQAGESSTKPHCCRVSHSSCPYSGQSLARRAACQRRGSVFLQRADAHRNVFTTGYAK